MCTAVGLKVLAVVAVAVRTGFWQATLTSIAAISSINYFFVPPILRFSIADPRSLVAMGT
jgi:two-component system sensor histidine kinase KdpD